jgi:hypothetical protein
MNVRLKTVWKPLLLGVFALWVAFVGLVGWEMTRPPEAFAQFMAKLPVPLYFVFPFETMWTQARSGHLNVGEMAPDFNLEKLDHTAKVSLTSLRMEKPVVLVFGSYT